MTDKPSIRETIAALTAVESENQRFLFAAAINLYIEGLRRISGRVLLSQDDIPLIFQMASILLIEKPDAFAPIKTRSRQLSDEEIVQVLEGVDKQIVETQEKADNLSEAVKPSPRPSGIGDGPGQIRMERRH